MDLGLSVMVLVSVVLSRPQRQGNARTANRDLQPRSALQRRSPSIKSVLPPLPFESSAPLW